MTVEAAAYGTFPGTAPFVQQGIPIVICFGEIILTGAVCGRPIVVDVTESNLIAITVPITCHKITIIVAEIPIRARDSFSKCA